MPIPHQRSAGGNKDRPPRYDPQALTDVADYIGTTREATYFLWPGVVHAWSGYLSTGSFGQDPVADLFVMEAVVSAGFDGVDLSNLDWRG